MPSVADDCSQYKYTPSVDVNIVDSETNIKSSDKKMDDMLGYTTGNFHYEIHTMPVAIRSPNGQCISIRGIDVNVGVNPIEIIIDNRIKPKSCAYNIVLSHERDHENVYRTTLKTYIDDIRRDVYDVVDSIKPVFVPNESDVNSVIKQIQSEIQSKLTFPDKINNIIESEQVKIDTRGDDYKIWQCDDFFNEMKNSWNGIVID